MAKKTQYDQYIHDVETGKQLSCKLVQLAIKRHLNDLKRDDIFFDRDEADKAIRFFKACRHTKGSYQNQLFNLFDWQAFAIASVYGWKRKDTGFRRFKRAYTEVAKKNGKTELLGAAALKALIGDKEKGAEVYSAATVLRQAKYVFNASRYMARRMCEDSPKIKDKFGDNGILTQNLNILETNSLYEPIPHDPERLDGINTSFAAVDEYGAHKTSDLYKNIETSMAAREQPLLWAITTAYFDKESPCYKLRGVCVDILKGVIENDNTFVLIYELDNPDTEWDNPAMWVKSNPTIGVTPRWDYMMDGLNTAKTEGKQAEIQFKTKNLNIWTSTSSTWIQDEVYQRALDDYTEEDLRGELCYGGLDLASERDIAAFVLFFPESKRILEWYFCPMDKVLNRKSDGGVDYTQWESDGWIIATEGDWIDFRFIKHTILDAMQKYDIKEIEYDAWGAAKMVQELIEEGAPFFPFRQGYKSMSPPAKELNNMFHQGTIKHRGNPVTRWMMGNVYITYDPTLAIKIDKSKSTDKVDGIVALVMAIGGWIDNRDDDIYSGDGVYVL